MFQRKNLTGKLHQFPVNFSFDTSINRKVIKIISYHLIKHFQLIKCEVSLTKNVNTVNEAARMNAKL